MGRVLCLTSSFPATDDDNAGIFVYHLARNLVELGWSVDVLTPHCPGLPTMEQRGGIRVFRFRYLWPESLEIFGHSGSTVVNLRKDALNYLKVVPLITLQGVQAIRRLLTDDYDLIHSHWVIPQGFNAMIATLVRRVPHIVTIHGGDIYSFNGILLRWVKSVILKRAQAITVNSGATLQQVRPLVPGHARIVQLPMGIEHAVPDREAVDRIRQQYRIGAGPLLLFVGRVVEEKGVGDVLKAVHELQADVPDVRLLIVGDGQERERFSRYVQELGLSGKALFVGHVPPARVSDYYGAADVFIGPSKKAADGWTEGLGLTFIEAMHAGLPVVATRSGGIVDSVQHEVTGLLVQENSPAEIAAAVKRLLLEPELVREIVRNGRAAAAEKYSWPAVAQKFSTLFTDVVQSARSGGE